MDEANETVLVNLTNPIGATIEDAQGVVTIIDDDGVALPAITHRRCQCHRRRFRHDDGVRDVSLSTTSNQTVTVAYSTANGTATAGQDYTSASSTVTFAPGQTSRVINISVTGDTTDEANETVLVNLASPVNATIQDSQAVLTILTTTRARPSASIRRPSNPDCVAPARGTGATGVTAEDAFPGSPGFSYADQDPAGARRCEPLVRAGAGRPGARVQHREPRHGEHLPRFCRARSTPTNSGGLLGLAFHPNFPATPEVFVSYTGTAGEDAGVAASPASRSSAPRRPVSRTRTFCCAPTSPRHPQGR